MLFIFTDESGDFTLTVTSAAQSLVGSLICTEKFHGSLVNFVSAFEAKYSSGHELKGSHLTTVQRLQVCRFLYMNRDHIKIVITKVDRRVTESSLCRYRKRQADTFRKNKESWMRAGGKSEHILAHYDRLIKTVELKTRLSDVEFLQATLLVGHLRETFQYCVVYFTEPKFRRCFEKFSFIFDAKNSTKLSKMEKYIQTNLMGFWDARSQLPGQSLVLVDEWRKGHPFIDRYTHEQDGRRLIDLRSVFSQGFQFHDSQSQHGLRMVDIVCNTVYSYFRDPENPELQQCMNLLRPVMGKGMTSAVLM